MKTWLGMAVAMLAAGVASAQTAQQATPRAADESQRPSAIRTGVFRGQPVTYAVINGKAVFEGDILLDHLDTLAPGARRAVPQGIGIAYPSYFWPKNGSGVAQIPYTVTSGSSNLDTALSQFNATFTGIIQFVARGSETDYVDFDLDTGNHNGTCESFVGHVGGAQQVGGSIDCNVGTLLHEMGHVVGLYHEQSRPDRDT